MSRNAKELCAMLITRSLKDLNEEEEEIVVDYLDDIGIEVDIDAKAKDICVKLMDAVRKKEKKENVPLTAYANSILDKGKKESDEKIKKQEVVSLMDKRKKEVKNLEEKGKRLPGCVPSETDILKGVYELTVDPSLGIVYLPDGNAQYTAMVSLSSDLYSKIFLEYENPVLEITTNRGFKGYSKIGEPHEEGYYKVKISPLVATILNVKGKDSAFLKLCTFLPDIAKVNFTYYGTKGDLEKDLSSLIEKVPAVVNAFSYLSLGMILVTKIEDRNVEIRVDGLFDSYERPIFSGLVPFGENELPFEIVPDL